MGSVDVVSGVFNVAYFLCVLLLFCLLDLCLLCLRVGLWLRNDC